MAWQINLIQEDPFSLFAILLYWIDEQVCFFTVTPYTVVQWYCLCVPYDPNTVFPVLNCDKLQLYIIRVNKLPNLGTLCEFNVWYDWIGLYEYYRSEEGRLNFTAPLRFVI
jgi:hypothetical protein